jgi:hypothetical protein
MNFLSAISSGNHIVRLLAKSTFYGQFWRGHQTIIWRTGKGFVQCSCLNGLSILKSISSWRKIGDYPLSSTWMCAKIVAGPELG